VARLLGVHRNTIGRWLARYAVGGLDAVLATPSLRTVFYVNNAARNAHSVRIGGLTHVQLYHGDSDKAVTASPLNQPTFDSERTARTSAGSAAPRRRASRTAFGRTMPRKLATT
jgi:hypothetical protein